MSASRTLTDDVEAPSCSTSVGPPHDTSCVSDKERSLSFANGQDACSSGAHTGFTVCELIVPNGDRYSGTLLGNMPDGSGKYIWSDGCIYEGEWGRGMRHGRGKITWPSGAVYEGEFSSDYMHGTGTYVGPDNLTYKGRWKLNLKHGLGYQTYPNGDVFEGSWIQGVVEGPGKYVWAVENIYVGNMKGGKMLGTGTLTWKTGDTYEGNWLDGIMHGFGIYTWNDGGCHVGTWTRGLKDGKGTFYPKGCRIPAGQEVYIDALRKRGLSDLKRQTHRSRILHSSSVDIGNMKVRETEGSGSGSSSILPKGNLISLEQSCFQNASLERRWSLEVAIENVTGHDMSCESVLENDEKVAETNVPILEREYMQGVLISEIVINNNFPLSSKKAKSRQRKTIKKLGKTIIKGHRSYDLMLSLQLGIRQYLVL